MREMEKTFGVKEMEKPGEGFGWVRKPFGVREQIKRRVDTEAQRGKFWEACDVGEGAEGSRYGEETLWVREQIKRRGRHRGGNLGPLGRCVRLVKELKVPDIPFMCVFFFNH